jgi:hypothetical protein
MNAAVITVRREPEYVFRSLLSLATSGGYPGPVHLFVGSDDDSYLAALAQNPRYVLHTMPSDEYAKIAGTSVTQKFNYNYWRALDYFAARGQGVCLCEDDVLYVEGFWNRLGAAVHEVGRDFDEYVLALYATGDFAADETLRRGRHYASYPAHMFFGTQGMYFPPSTVRGQADYLRRRGVDRVEDPADLLIRDLCIERQYLYVAASSLVQHIGRVSTGLGHFHSSPTFQAV